jgi:pimeloyl-ACP methyl ester carboxylesterase
MRSWRWIARLGLAYVCALSSPAIAQITERVVDVPTRTGITERIIVLTPSAPKAVVILLAGGHGGLQIANDGSMQWGKGNFLVRSRRLFADHGLMVVVLDAPSDRQSPPYLDGFRQTKDHAADLKAVIAWSRETARAPVWLVGTSRGTQSAAYVATELPRADGPDGVVLSSTILTDPRSRPVTAMPLGNIAVPVLVVHHEQDACRLCNFADVPSLMSKLSNAPRKELLAFKGGENRGDPCEAFAYHGYNGLEGDVVRQTAAWILAK